LPETLGDTDVPVRAYAYVRAPVRWESSPWPRAYIITTACRRAGVNFAVVLMAAGKYHVKVNACMRAASRCGTAILLKEQPVADRANTVRWRAKPPVQFVGGAELSGTVLAVGGGSGGVRGFNVGDRVVALPALCGAFAGDCIVDASTLFAVPTRRLPGWWRVASRARCCSCLTSLHRCEDTKMLDEKKDNDVLQMGREEKKKVGA
jgi:NADPH:quinone reductase-like Zn-dependent oxidoreductase